VSRKAPSPIRSAVARNGFCAASADTPRATAKAHTVSLAARPHSVPRARCRPPERRSGDDHLQANPDPRPALARLGLAYEPTGCQAGTITFISSKAIPPLETQHRRNGWPCDGSSDRRWCRSICSRPPSRPGSLASRLGSDRGFIRRLDCRARLRVMARGDVCLLVGRPPLGELRPPALPLGSEAV